jgi:hypothetical protein
MSSRIERRLEDSVRALLQTVPALAVLSTKERDENAPIRGKKAAPRPVLIIHAQDQGRVKTTPIREIRLSITLRSNAQTDAGSAEAFDGLSQEIEDLLDSTNLQTALTSSSLGITVMLAIRSLAGSFSTEGDIRKQSFVLDTRCVASENVAV